MNLWQIRIFAKKRFDIRKSSYKLTARVEEHNLCSTWWLVNYLKIDLQMERFGFGLADLPPDLKIGGFANRFAYHFCDFVFANGRFVRTNSTFFVQIRQYFFSNRQNDLTFANRPTNSQP